MVEAVRDKGSGALIDVRQESRADDGSLAWVNRYAMFARDCGSFESSPPPAERTPRMPPPARDPDAVATVATLPHQAALYRHSGDDTRFTWTPSTPGPAGSRPRSCRACARSGSPSAASSISSSGARRAAIRRVGARFSGVVVPGETLRIESWRLRDGEVFRVSTEAGSTVLSGGELLLESA